MSMMGFFPLIFIAIQIAFIIFAVWAVLSIIDSLRRTALALEVIATQNASRPSAGDREMLR
ncbi:MAG: hypothetical protein IT368_01215 [Candidatus Hydrogenedentes bacterium]|nr:hypothetical protein [Candidatus Hydrogenedentota bacterium]